MRERMQHTLAEGKKWSKLSEHQIDSVPHKHHVFEGGHMEEKLDKDFQAFL